LRRTLSRHAAVAPHDWRFVSDAHGRPFVDTRGGHPAIAFNLSHTRGLAACAVSGAAEIGVDVEEMRPSVGLLEVARHNFAPAEQADLRAAGDEAAMRRHFYALWTLKESYIKARSLGLSLPLQKFAFAWGDARIDLTIDAALGDAAADWWFALAAPSPEHRLAVALRTPGPVTLTLFGDSLRDAVPPEPLSLALLARSERQACL